MAFDTLASPFYARLSLTKILKKLNELKINRVNKEKVFSYKIYVKTIHINTERIR